MGQGISTFELDGQINPDALSYGQAMSWTVTSANEHGNAHTVTASS